MKGYIALAVQGSLLTPAIMLQHRNADGKRFSNLLLRQCIDLNSLCFPRQVLVRDHVLR
jgi:hypothetical protein